MNENKYRITFAILGLLLGAVVVFAVLGSPSGREIELPTAVESIEPANDATVLRQTDLVVNMAVGYEIDLVVDGELIPRDEMTITEATGVHVWRPGPGRTFEEWSPGIHTIQVDYTRLTGTADVGTVRWVFRAQ